MARVALNSGAYSAVSLIANAQKCFNLFPEANPPETGPPVPVTHYLTPGLLELALPTAGCVRGVYRATTGAFFACVGTNVYFFDLDFSSTLCGTIDAGTTPVSFMDNGITLILVDGTEDGYYLELGTVILAPIVDDAFYGANRVQYLNGLFIFNRPDTNQFYVSPFYWNGIDPLDPLYIASKTGGPDKIISISVIHMELWLVGALTSEVWYYSGDADFPLARQPSVFVDHGMLLGWSLCEADEQNFFMGRDRQGQCMAFTGTNYQAQRISNHAIEAEWQNYAVVSDIIGFTYQQNGHTFVVFIFPSADKTWVYDMSTGQWHERGWTDAEGAHHRIRPNCYTFAFNRCIVGDWENGKIYAYDPNVYTDDGDLIYRERGFPHLVDDGVRIAYTKFQVDMQCGSFAGSPVSPDILLDWSDDRGASYGDVVTMSLGTTGQYNQSPTVQRLGYARDRVFRLRWSFPYKTALQGAWITAEKAET